MSARDAVDRETPAASATSLIVARRTGPGAAPSRAGTGSDPVPLEAPAEGPVDVPVDVPVAGPTRGPSAAAYDVAGPWAVPVEVAPSTAAP
ncbi:hypothetical protein CAE01nite_31590 [Cellulomonas aerilata]|uniref:Uncharacterized protein n=1 Tax=Cellulomonas aerilata TaxID=515326 RepID=A0A512DG16_9CELL|nr:hypothetical protein CAE01nite_31590 [Cellulomonas aerilata]